MTGYSSNNQSVSLVLEIDTGNPSDQEALKQITYNLRSEIQQIEVESVELISSQEMLKGMKSVSAVTFGSLLVSILPAVLPKLLDLLQNWLTRGENRKIKIKTQIDEQVLEAEFVPTAKSIEELKDIIHILQNDMAAEERKNNSTMSNSTIQSTTFKRESPPSNPPQESTNAKKFALVIGNSVYNDPTLSKLITPTADVDALVETLRNPKIGCFDGVIPLINQTSSEIRRNVSQFFTRRNKDDLLLLYFSGHGVLDENGDLYLAAKDTDRNLIQATALESSFIAKEMGRSYSKRKILILDCCHSGAFANGAKGCSGAKIETARFFGGSGYGQVILTATDSTQYAWEGDAVIGNAEHSVFTHYLIQGLETGEADRDADGLIGLHELYEYVSEKVQSETPKQTPEIKSDQKQGDMVIARNPRHVIKPAELPQALREAIDNPLPRIKEGAVKELNSLLSHRDKGLVLAAEQALERLTDDDSRRVSDAAKACLVGYRATGEPHKSEPIYMASNPANTMNKPEDKAKQSKDRKNQPINTITKTKPHIGNKWEGIEKIRPAMLIVMFGWGGTLFIREELVKLVGILRENLSFDAPFLVSIVAIISGVLLSLFIGLALKKSNVLQWRQILLLIIAWAACYGITYHTFTRFLYFGNLLWERDILHGLVVGSLGGLMIGLIIKRTNLHLYWYQILVITVGWAIALIVKNFILSLIHVDTFIGTLYFISGMISGGIGSGIMFLQLKRIRQRVN